MDYAIEILSGGSLQNCHVVGVYPLHDKKTFGEFWHYLEHNTSFTLVVDSIQKDFLIVTVDKSCEYYQVSTAIQGQYYDEYTSLKILIKENDKIERISEDEYNSPERSEILLVKLEQWMRDRI